MPNISEPDSGRNYVIVSPESSVESILSIDRSIVEELYKKFGAILFRSFELNVNTFKEMTEKFCTAYIQNDTGNRDYVSKEKGVQTVDLGKDSFPLHPEISSAPWRPDVAWFACQNPPSKDGETLLCDGVELAEGLPDALRVDLERRWLRYVTEIESDGPRFWLGTADPSDELMANTPPACPFTFERKGDKFNRVYTVPFLHKPMFTDKRAWGNFLFFARSNGDMLDPTFGNGTIVPDKIVDVARNIGNEVSVPVKWEKDDLVMVDNTRFMHGRNIIHDAKERQISTLFGFINFAVPLEREVVNPPWRKPKRKPQ